MSRITKGGTRSPEEVMKMIISQLETGYRRMHMRHAEELDRQQTKLKAAKAKLEAIQAASNKEGK